MPHQTLDAVLSAAVRIITDGAADQPRPAQKELAHEILDRMLAAANPMAAKADSQIACESPTGSGKSLAYLAPAMVMNALYGHRTVVSTESLMLQDQVLNKDAPQVAQAVEEVTGTRPKTGLLKGWSNYVCVRDAVVAAETVLGLDEDEHASATNMAAAMESLAAFVDDHGKMPTSGSLRKILADPDAAMKTGGGATVDVDGRDFPAKTLVPLVNWALDGGDKRDYVGSLDGGVWSQVSTTTSECTKDKCPFADECTPILRRQEVSQAGIVITNHAYLAVQAATGFNVLMDSKTVGKVEHLVCDETHALIGNVRAASSLSLSKISWLSMVKRFGTMVEDRGLLEQGRALSDLLDHDLMSPVAGKRGQVGLADGEDALNPHVSQRLIDWLTQAKGALPKYSPSWPQKTQRAHRRASSALDSMDETLSKITDPPEGTARWVDVDRREANAAPIDVGAAMAGNLYVGDFEEAKADGERDTDATEVDNTYTRSVTAVSATMPNGYGRDAGMSVPVLFKPSPFEAEYANSAAFIPAVHPADVPLLTSDRYGSTKFDTEKHAQWCVPILVELVRANGGSALVLAAKGDHGKAYAEALRQADLGVTILDQWGQLSVGEVVRAWKEDESSVLVGTKSLMTGVDAPGVTNSLVIIDRPPRSPANVLDDARVESLMSRASMSKWSAMDAVYGEDTALLMKQAVGRLIRRHGDSGAVAILDPRLVPGNAKVAKAVSNGASTRNTYLKALASFRLRTSDLPTITGWMQSRK